MDAEGYKVVYANGQVHGIYATAWEARAIRDAVAARNLVSIVPLYRSPGLTDREREALDFAANELRWHNWSPVIRNLLERSEK